MSKRSPSPAAERDSDSRREREREREKRFSERDAPSKDDDRSERRGPRGGASSEACYGWQNTGSCRFGDSCKFSHQGRPGTGSDRGDRRGGRDFDRDRERGGRDRFNERERPSGRDDRARAGDRFPERRPAGRDGDRDRERERVNRFGGNDRFPARGGDDRRGGFGGGRPAFSAPSGGPGPRGRGGDFASSGTFGRERKAPTNDFGRDPTYVPRNWLLDDYEEHDQPTPTGRRRSPMRWTHDKFEDVAKEDTEVKTERKGEDTQMRSEIESAPQEEGRPAQTSAEGKTENGTKKEEGEAATTDRSASKRASRSRSPSTSRSRDRSKSSSASRSRERSPRRRSRSRSPNSNK